MRTLALLSALALTSCLDAATPLDQCGPEPVRAVERLSYSADGSVVAMPDQDWRALQKWANAEHDWGACLSGVPASVYPIPQK